MSTSKSFGAANFALSLGEDAAVLTMTLLSVYAPWLMLVVVIIFALVFAFLGPRIWRTLSFDLSIAGSAMSGNLSVDFSAKLSDQPQSEPFGNRPGTPEGIHAASERDRGIARSRAGLEALPRRTAPHLGFADLAAAALDQVALIRQI